MVVVHENAANLANKLTELCCITKLTLTTDSLLSYGRNLKICKHVLISANWYPRIFLGVQYNCYLLLLHQMKYNRHKPPDAQNAK